MPTNEKHPYPQREAALEMSPETFRELGHHLVDLISDFMGQLKHKPVAPGKDAAQIQALLEEIQMDAAGTPARKLIDETANLLFENSTFNGHPRFLGYITSSAAPIGILSELLAASINPNMGGYQLSPIASEIERQCVRWLCQLVGYPEGSGGILSSGGNMANFIAFLAARRHVMGAEIREKGLKAQAQGRVYASKETHTWIQKAADLFGFGTEHIHWIDTDDKLRIRPEQVREAIQSDRAAGFQPLMVIGTAGSVSTGVVDDLESLADICDNESLWFHVDGAYGAVACIANDYKDQFSGMSRAHSIALDPHKWLYSPLEAGCTLVRDAKVLPDTFSYRPPYYDFEDEKSKEINYYEHGVQNSRGFRALKVWMSLRQAGLSGYRKMIDDDCKLAETLFRIVDNHPEMEARSCHLSITTFRFIPVNRSFSDEELNTLNKRILHIMKKEGQLFVSNAVIGDTFYLRSCIVNFRTSELDIRKIPALVCDIGRRLIG